MPVFPVLQGGFNPKPNFPRMPGVQEGSEVRHLPPEARKSHEIHQLLVVRGSGVPWVQVISQGDSELKPGLLPLPAAQGRRVRPDSSP